MLHAFFIVMLLCMAQSIDAMHEEKVQDDEIARNHYVATKTKIKALQQQAGMGDLISALAVYDFYGNMRDPHYKIEAPFSKRLLEKFDLIDNNGRVSQATREAFKKYEK